MSNQRDSKAVELSGQVYRRLLLAYPKSHREEYGAAILQLFRDQCRDAWAARRARGLVAFWLRALADLLKTSLLEHLSKLNRSRIMPTLFRPTIKPLPAFFGICAAVFLPIFFANAVITFLIPEMYKGSATVLIARPNSAPDPDWTQTEVQMISSPVVLEKTAKNLDLQAVWSKKYNNGQPMHGADVMAMLKARLDISVVKPSSAPVIARVVSSLDNSATVWVDISAYSDNAEEAATLANGVVNAYRAFREEQDHQAGTPPFQRRVTVMNSAAPQRRPVRPNKYLNIFIGALAGIFIAVITAPLILGFFAWIKNRRNPPVMPQNA